MSKTIIKLPPGVGAFSEDKDEAKRIRNDELMPALEAGSNVIIDFANMQYSTQSFVHALIGSALHKYKEPVLQHIEFKNCAPQIKSLVQLVVDYSLGGFKEADKKAKSKTLALSAQNPSTRRSGRRKLNAGGVA